MKKKNLAEVAVHFGITPDVGATKSHILDLIENYCIDNDIIDEADEKTTAETPKVLKLKLEFEREERRLACEEAHEEAQRAREKAQKAREAAEAEAQKAREAARELRLAELKEACELRELELKAQREKRDLELKAEQEKALLEAEKEAAAREHELKMACLGKQPASDKAFDPARNIRLVPPFQEKEVHKYL